MNDDATDDRSPTRETLAAFRAQWTPQAMCELLEYAERRARMVRVSGRACPPPAQYARELVHDVHAFTWSGELSWDPNRCSLVTHLRRAIKSRTRHEIDQAARRISLDVHAAAEEREGPKITSRDALASSPDAVGPLVFPALVARVCDELHEAASKYPDCVAMLRAWERGVIERDEVLEVTGLDEAAYHRARQRLLYASRTLSSELRRLVQEYLRSAT